MQILATMPIRAEVVMHFLNDQLNLQQTSVEYLQDARATNMNKYI